MCTFIDSISFCSFLFSIACARAVLTSSLWSNVWSENVWTRRALKCGVMWDVYYARALSQQSNRTTFHMMPVRHVLRHPWKHTSHVGIEHICAFIDSISYCSLGFTIASAHAFYDRSQFFFVQGEYDSENTTTSSSSSTFCFHAVICFLLRAVAPLRFMMDYVTDTIPVTRHPPARPVSAD